MKEDWANYTIKSKYAIHEDEVVSVKDDRYICLTSLATCIDCKGCDKKGE